jgi:hypothetical protein
MVVPWGRCGYRIRVRSLSRTLPLRCRHRARSSAAPLAGALVAGLVAALTTTLTTTLPAAPASATVQPGTRQISYTQWTTNPQFSAGRFVGTRSVRGTLRISDPVGTTSYVDPHGKPTKRYDFGRWVSPWQRPGYAFDQLVPSWDAVTPRDSWVQVQVRGRSESGRRSRWYTMANWAAGDATFRRTSVPNQSDGLAYVDVDTLRTKYSMGFTAWQMRVTLLRRAGKEFSPGVETVGAMTSLLPEVASVRTSRPGVASGLPPLEVPRWSQMVHTGHYPQYGNGGEAWCSPTSVSMVLGYYDRLPAPEEYAWVSGDHAEPWVDHAARMHYDYAYRGAGNWSFSTAYASSHADAAFVTRLRNLRELERFIKVGIPVVASIRFSSGQLTGSPIRASNGHLLVVVGFTASGDVIVNDPAASSNGGVRRVYRRGEFENVWIPGSGGLVYVIRDQEHRLPFRGRLSNW